MTQISKEEYRSRAFQVEKPNEQTEPSMPLWAWAVLGLLIFIIYKILAGN